MRSGIRDTQLVSEKASGRKTSTWSVRTCKLAELFLDGTCLPAAVNALRAAVSKCKDHSWSDRTGFEHSSTHLSQTSEQPVAEPCFQ